MKTEAPGATVGIVIRTKDRPFFVLRALKSVAAQIFEDWHIMLVNDGGNAAELDAAIAGAGLPQTVLGKMTRLHLDPGLGRSAAFNRGAQTLRTEFVTCLDDDDTWAPEFLAELVAFFRETSANVPEMGGVLARVTALREELVETPEGYEIKVIGEDNLAPAFRRSEFFINPLAYACYRQDLYPIQWMLRRDAALEVGGFPEVFDVMEDRAFMNLFLMRYRLALLDRPLAYHHRRVNRSTDNQRSVLLNTLDNPSYDWRLFADLARPGFDLAKRAIEAQLLRSIAADLLAEVNYETSAIWQKVHGEMRTLSTRLDADKAELIGKIDAVAERAASLAQELPEAGADAEESGAQETDWDSRPQVPLDHPAPDLHIAPEKLAYDLWHLFETHEHAQHVAPGVRFAERLELSRSASQQGLLLHVTPALRRFELQIPETRDWCAVELALDGLALPGGGLRCHVHLASPEGYLFETALTHFDPSPEDPSRHRLDDFQIHACHAGRGGTMTREIDAGWLARVKRPKLSLILPRFAQNFRFVCKNVVIEHVSVV